MGRCRTALTELRRLSDYSKSDNSSVFMGMEGRMVLKVWTKNINLED